MSISTSDPGELLFERYLTEGGYGFDHAYDFGIAKSPDYLVSFGSVQAVCEVKSFDTIGIFGDTPDDNGLLSRTTKQTLAPIRNHIRSAAEQLQPLAETGWPLVVVLANPRRCPVNLDPAQVMAAMYGDLSLVGTIHADGREDEWRQIAGRNGKLRNQHPYISAVAVLRQQLHAQAWIDEWFLRHNVEQFTDHDAYLAAFMKAAEADAPTGEDISLDVFETASETATPLPPDWFRGPLDRRWKPNEEHSALVLDSA